MLRMIRLNWTIALMASGLLAFAMGFLLGHWTSGTAQPTGPAVEAGFPPCRKEPLAHVRQPTRFVVVSNCVSASGTVRQIEFQIHDGDYRIFVDPDPEYVGLLAPGNEGQLVVEVIAADRPSVFLPTLGQHATFYGALVLNRGQDRRVEVHPAWLITTLDVTVTVPSSVAVGETLGISVDVASTRDGITRPVSEASLFLEFMSDNGTAVRWETARTNTLGQANVNLAGLERAGDYTMTVYVSKDRESDVGQATFKIRRR